MPLTQIENALLFIAKTIRETDAARTKAKLAATYTDQAYINIKEKISHTKVVGNCDTKC